MLEDLSAYADRSFDLVMSFDAPISYTHPHQETVIAELVRIAKKRILISVSSRLGALPYLANPLQKFPFFLNPDSENSWVQWSLSHRKDMLEGFTFEKAACDAMLETGFLGDQEQAKAVYDRGETPWCITYHFLPEELTRILEENGVKNIKMAGPGALARTMPNEILRKIMNDPKQKAEFLAFCHIYDSNPYVCGMGKDNLFAKGEIE